MPSAPLSYLPTKNFFSRGSVHLMAAAICLGSAFGADLVLLSDGKSEYQIVLPDQLPSPELTNCLTQTARLAQAAFAANGADVEIVTESAKKPGKPALYLGATVFAKAHGISTADLPDWTYLFQAAGRDLIIAGNDAPAKAQTDKKRLSGWDRVGTAKAMADFAREFLGVRFLYPELPGYTPVAGAAKIDFLKSPAIEFLRLKTIVVPDALNVRKVPTLRVNTSHPAGGGFYDLAHNRFPRVDELFGGHTWQRAIPPEQHYATHPEYFALLSGSRQKPDDGNAQYCLSNPDVQELIYQDLASSLDRGFSSVDLGQPDGFRECQCQNCANLFGTGKDWGEKIWIFNRQVAERLLASHPHGQVTMMSYILTAVPPKTFTVFPANTCVMLTGTNEEDFQPWRAHTVPRGFTGYIYNWCPNLGSRYTPMRTPSFVETQVRRLVSNKVQGIFRDGPGQLFGLEGPVYYVMGRMLDDPQRLKASELVPEFCDAAFGKAAPAMKSFYRSLYHYIALYSDQIGTRCDVWRTPSYEGNPLKTVQDPFRLLAFLYPPNLLDSLSSDLTEARKLADTPKVKTRLALVELEFEYVRLLARVVHLYHAFQTQPDIPSRDRLLDAIDARNAFIAALYDKQNRSLPSADWGHTLYPFPGHNAEHLRLARDGYQEPYSHTCLNWDTKVMRSAPMPGRRSTRVKRSAEILTPDSPLWNTAEPELLTAILPLNSLPRTTKLRLLYDSTYLYVLSEAELEPSAAEPFKASKRDTPLLKEESLDLYLQPAPSKDRLYRFMAGPGPDAKYDALNGAITDLMDPRHGKDDPTWNGEWRVETRFEKTTRVWRSQLSIPFHTLETPPPSPGTRWLANFARHHLVARGKQDDSIWSSSASSHSMDDRSVFGELLFE